jgi:N-acetylglutamate synthase and related acetyltransferases
MYVRDAKDRDEMWLRDHIESMGLDTAPFRYRDYVIAVNEDTNARAGFGRTLIHDGEPDNACELTGIGVLESWRGQGVGAHVIERLLGHARDDDFDTVYSISAQPEYLRRFGFQPAPIGELPGPIDTRLEEKRAALEEGVVSLALDVDSFAVPPSLRERFKSAAEIDPDPVEVAPEELAEEFGIDPDTATYKYDTD